MARRFSVSQKSLSAALLKDWLGEMAERINDDYDGHNNMSICLRHLSAIEEQLDHIDEKNARNAMRAQYRATTVKISQAAEKLMAQYSIEVSEVVGSGKDGAINKGDVDAVIERLNENG